MKSILILIAILIVDIGFLIFQTSELSISYRETQIISGDFSPLKILINFSFKLFGINDFSLRAPMIALHIFSAILMYLISKFYISHKSDRLWLVVIFLLLPGVISSALIVDFAGILIFTLLIFIYINQYFSRIIIYIYLFMLSLLSGVFIYLFISLFIYNIYKKNNSLLAFDFALILLSVFMYGVGINQSISGHFIDTLGLYGAIFTPIIFIYIFYSLHRVFLLKELDILWFISTTTLLISLLLSIRQNIAIEEFAPYIIPSLLIAGKTFSFSYRSRLKIFRKKYKLIFIMSLFFLFSNYLILISNKELYHIVDIPDRHFSYNMHIAKDLAKELKSMQIDCIYTDSNMQKRLNFYGVSECRDYLLEQYSKHTNNIFIYYKNILVYKANVTKINTQ